MAKRKDAYLDAMGYNKDKDRQNLPFTEWVVSKFPAAAGGLFAHEVYDLTTTKWFATLVPRYGRDIVGSLGLAIVAYSLDHNLNMVVWKRPGFSDDMTEGFTDGMIGRGAPALFSAVGTVLKKVSDYLSGDANAKKPVAGKPAQAMLPQGQEYTPNLDDAPAALGDMMALLASSPKTRQMLTEDLLGRMENRGIEISPNARTNIANCIGDLAQSYKRA